MERKIHSATFGQGALNTLAQTGTDHYAKPAVIIQGEGAELGNDKRTKGKAKRKFVGQKIALSLIDVAASKGDDERLKSFWNTYHCQSRIYTHEGRQYGQYCKNRFCPLCSSIRKAAMINRYYPVIREWGEPYFVTLTLKACSAKKLRKWMEGLNRGFRKISAKYRKQYQRGTGHRLMGIKCLECNFNPVRRTYNPHLHLIVASEAMAETIIQDWLTLCTPKFATRAAQHSRPIRNLETDLIETIKYGSKIFTEPDRDRNLQSQASPKIYARALYNIYEAMRGLRIFERFGFDAPKSNKQIVPARVVTDYNEWVFLPEYHDWQNTESELVLSAIEPAADLVALLQHGIDRELE